MSPLADIYVVIYQNNGLYNHWSLFIDGPTEEEKLLLHIEGRPQHFRFESKYSNAHKSAKVLEMIKMCRVAVSKTAEIEKIAEEQEVKNQYAGYNCQDYNIELLDRLEECGLIDRTDPDYKEKKELVKSKQKGLF
ncbi:hypothetical protein BO94DRAFT_609984 [Aspergillus sclerotioniger CBS 115572]|uniref:Uncharacterized protein n=1 Tax=Aspergillus sclerotioniger CBS 115572 TaxID=1450535 RepID=A0A317X7J0_9EURO|nr:hypothetical protein BO94DRAFT_609984 [Aspergillus sclerotioniger CBS 115572]PWY94573.1 hypothetical protein BO94DRAFT_609984 [Aspergillus sclerotioniger CBS 115572]